MARVTGRKLRPTHVAQGGAMPFDFGADKEYQVYGFHMHPSRRIQVEVPIFDHGFYPKLEHTPTDIKQEIKYRVVTMPSLADLRKEGIAAPHGIYVADIWVNPRYIKNWNYFRTDFPANMKAYAKREGFVLVFPANDMISARAKRKETLALWRNAFTPLFIDGRQYTSGRITHFFCAPPSVSQGFRMKLNLESDEEFNNLLEWDPATWRLAERNSPRPRRIPIEDRAVDELAERLAAEMGPLVSSKLEAELTQHQREEINRILGDDKMAETLLQQTQNKQGTTRLMAVKRWLRNTAWPEIKDFLVRESIEAGRAVASFVWMTAVSVAVNHTLDNLQGSDKLATVDDKVAERWKRMHPYRASLQRHAKAFKYTPGGRNAEVELGGGTLSYKGNSTQGQGKLETILKEQMAQLYIEFSRDSRVGIMAEEIFDLKLLGNRVRITLNVQTIEDAIAHGEIEGKFVHAEDGHLYLNDDWVSRVKSFTIPRMERRLSEFYRELREQGY